MRKTGTTKNCANCGTSFYVPGWSPAKFCSTACFHAVRPQAELICQRCNKPFRVRSYRRESARFCSKQCQNLTVEERRKRKKAAGLAYYQANKPRFSAYIDKNREHIYAGNRRRHRENPERATKWNRKRRAKYGEKLRAARRKHYRDNQPIYVAQARAREKRIKQATPKWADMKAIEAFYVQAAAVTKATGVKHHVDHFYPIKSPIMCGLHVEANLRVLPAVVNLAKSNRVVEDAAELRCCAWPTI